ncbi:PPOX class F420-dependent oxidoreductase [Actinomadura miaoliensis]|uniref:PPOX class F420-dependent oxidoreductase n=1 Tax=Actinomadura miaoliensis TaxID=430685 RepID=A0ABP7WAL6_9ACTN
MSLTEIEREYLSTQRLGRLATVGPKGDPQNNPVGFAYNEETGTIDIYGRNLANTRKFRNVRRNDQVSLVIDDLVSTDPWAVRGIEIRGRAEALTEQAVPGSYLSPEIIRIHPRIVFSWGIDPSAEGMTKRVVTMTTAQPQHDDALDEAL